MCVQTHKQTGKATHAAGIDVHGKAAKKKRAAARALDEVGLSLTHTYTHTHTLTDIYRMEVRWFHQKGKKLELLLPLPQIRRVFHPVQTHTHTREHTHTFKYTGIKLTGATDSASAAAAASTIHKRVTLKKGGSTWEVKVIGSTVKITSSSVINYIHIHIFQCMYVHSGAWDRELINTSVRECE